MGILTIFWSWMFASKPASLLHVSNSMLRSEWLHTPWDNIMCSVKSWLYNCIWKQNFDFQAYLPFVFSLSNQFISREVCFQYTSKTSTWLKRSNNLKNFMTLNPYASSKPFRCALCTHNLSSEQNRQRHTYIYIYIYIHTILTFC